MNFDVVIIGGGLAGLTCGIALQQRGKRCVIINNGQAAMDFSSGSMDLLNVLPSSEKVEQFCKSYAQLQSELPQHPYCLLGKEKVLENAQQFERLAKFLVLGLEGTTAENHLRVTPLGGLRSTWLSPSSVPTVYGEPFIHRQIAILGIEGYHDFQPQLLAENLVRQTPFQHCQFQTAFLNIPELDQLRNQAREFRSVNIAQFLACKLAFPELVNEIKTVAKNATAIFLPACFGGENQDFFQQLKEAVGIAMYELPTLPPSLLGIRQYSKLHGYFEQLGGMILKGDRAVKVVVEQQTASKMYTRLHQEDTLSASHFVLATGSFFSNGLVAEFERIVEPLFNADIIGNSFFDKNDRLSWTVKRFTSPQPYQSAGVAINEKCQIRQQGRFLNNVYAVGNVIGGYNALELGCGSGVAVVTAFAVAEQILQQSY